MRLECSDVLVPRIVTELDAPIDPRLIPVPGPLDFNSITLTRILRILNLPHVNVLRGYSEPVESGFLNLSYHVLWTKLRLLHFLPNPILPVNCLRKVRLRINELDHLVRLSRAIDELALEEEPKGETLTVILVVTKLSVEFSDIGA